jgi:hypothetical protein
VALDGREYFRSTQVPGPQCLRQPDPPGRVHYSHQLVGATMVRAGSHQVVPLDGEEVRNATAERAPQDWELTAGKRLSARLRREHPQRAGIGIGEDLSAHGPFVEQLQQLRPHYVLVAKPSSPPTLLAAVVAAEGTEQSQTGQGTEGSGARQRPTTSRLMRPLPLARESPVRGTYVEVWEHRASGSRLSPKSWITALDIDIATVAVVVQLGRTRGKMEQEQFHGHKNHGYELTHTYGPGQQTLARVFYLLNLLASVTHVVLVRGARLSQRCRAQESRRELWNALRGLVNAVLVESWQYLLQIYLEETDASP